MMKFLAIVSCGCFVLSVAASGQNRAQGATAGTARISGAVLAVNGSAQPGPGRRAIVTLTGSSLPVGRSVVSDDNGRFAFDRLPAGRFLLTAAKPAYLTGAYGATRPGRPGVPLTVAAGDQIADLSITITHGAAIAGTIRDVSGTPALGATVSAVRVLPDGTLTNAVTIGADDRGAFRFFGLTAGDYLVSATRGRATGLGEIGDMTSDEIDRKLASLRTRRTSPTGSTTPAAVPAPPERTSNFAPVFYAHAFSTADAAKVAVGFGEERLGVDIVIDRLRSVVIVGSIAGVPPGSPVSFRISQPGPVSQSTLDGPMLAGRARGDGPFQYNNVTPGRYTITAKTDGVRPALWARAEVDVNGEDVRGVSLVMQPVLHLTGRLVFDATRLVPPADLTSIRVSLEDAAPRPFTSNGAAVAGAQPAATTDARGNFDVADLTPGLYRLTTSLPPDPNGWWLRSAVVNGRDILDSPIRIDSASPLAGAVLTFSDRHTSLSGALETPPDRPASTYYIVVFPEDRSLWLPRARRIQSVRPGTDGQFLMRDLPPGAYRLAALTDLQPDDLIDAAFFDSLISASIRVTLADGEQKTQNLRVGGS